MRRVKARRLGRNLRLIVHCRCDIYARLIPADAGYPLSGKIGKMLRQIVPVVQTTTASLPTRGVMTSAAAIGDITTQVRTQYLADHVEEISAFRIPTFTVEA